MDLRTFADRLAPTAQELAVADQALSHLRHVLDARARDGLLPQSTQRLIIGSAARQTMNSPIDDVDLLYVIGNARFDGVNKHSLVDCTFDFTRQLDGHGLISSLSIVNLFRNQLQTRYTTSDVKRDGEAAVVALTSYGLKFDIVPAVYSLDLDAFLVPIGHGWANWKYTDPRLDVMRLDLLDQAHGGLARPTIRVIKHWFEVKKVVAPRSYHIESLAIRAFSEGVPLTTIRDLLLRFFGSLNEEVLYQCPDPTGWSYGVSSDLDYEGVQRILLARGIALRELANGGTNFVNYLTGSRTAQIPARAG